jgi:hypothetical protein
VRSPFSRAIPIIAPEAAKRVAYATFLRTHLSGYSLTGDLTDSVQVAPEFLSNKSSKKFAPAKLSNKVTLFAMRFPRARWKNFARAIG